MPDQPQAGDRNHQQRSGHAPDHIRLWGAAQRNRGQQTGFGHGQFAQVLKPPQSWNHTPGGLDQIIARIHHGQNSKQRNRKAQPWVQAKILDQLPESQHEHTTSHQFHYGKNLIEALRLLGGDGFSTGPDTPSGEGEVQSETVNRTGPSHDQLPDGKRVVGRLDRGHQIWRSPGAAHIETQNFIPIQQIAGETDHHESTDKNPPNQTMPWTSLAASNRQRKGQKGADITSRHTQSQLKRYGPIQYIDSVSTDQIIIPATIPRHPWIPDRQITCRPGARRRQLVLIKKSVHAPDQNAPRGLSWPHDVIRVHQVRQRSGQRRASDA